MSNSDQQLISAAKKARERAHCRYSGFSVGAALVDDRGRVHVGCNVENASYPLGNCAEASAISAMILDGGKRISRIAVIGGSDAPVACTPCGGCRQRIYEFADDDTTVIALDGDGNWVRYSIAELLPAGFRLL